jgi:ABC-type enterochelin transport system permease subunit
LISGFFQLTTGIGLIGAVVVWQANALADLFTLDRDQRESLKRYKRRALKSAVVLVVLGPLYSVAGAMMGLPLATCVDLTPL